MMWNFLTYLTKINFYLIRITLFLLGIIMSRWVSFTLIPRKVIDSLILETISRHRKSKKVSSSSQHGIHQVEVVLDQLDNLSWWIDWFGRWDESSGRCLSKLQWGFQHDLPQYANRQADTYGLDKQTGGLTAFWTAGLRGWWPAQWSLIGANSWCITAVYNGSDPI